MMKSNSTRVLQAFFVTFLWSTSWILIKLTITNISPLYFAGLRYLIGFIVLAIVVLIQKKAEKLSLHSFLWISVYGVIMITLTQGSQFVALSILPTIMVSLALNATPIVVAIVGYFLLKERLIGYQKVGVLLYSVGVLMYFYPFQKINDIALGLLVALLAIVFNASATLLGRKINQKRLTNSTLLTMISMGVGSVLLLMIASQVETFPTLDGLNVLTLLWLGVVNTALAFTLWNHALEKITATSASLINSTMLIQIALLSWVFLSEALNLRQIIAVLIVFGGVMMVQVFKKQGQTQT